MVAANQLTGLNWPALLLGTVTVAAPGLCTVTSTIGLKVGMSVQFTLMSVPAPNQSHRYVVKAVLSDTEFVVYDPHQKTGTVGQPVQEIVDPVIYSGGTASVPQQPRQSPVPTLTAVFDDAPTTALRSVTVDALGNYITATNPLPVAAEVTVGPVTAMVNLDAFTKTPPDNTLVDGTEDGTLTGTKHVMKIDSLGNVQVADNNKLIPEVYDTIAATYPTTTQTVYTYKTGGLGGTTVATLTVNYTDATQANILNVVRT